ncbi:hypothetical protein JCM8547_000914 [Rhodosporidiobolus lusitaniae]
MPPKRPASDQKPDPLANLDFTTFLPLAKAANLKLTLSWTVNGDGGEEEKEEKVEFECVPKVFSTGSFGWTVSGKIPALPLGLAVEENDDADMLVGEGERRVVPVGVSCNLTVQGSKKKASSKKAKTASLSKAKSASSSEKKKKKDASSSGDEDEDEEEEEEEAEEDDEPRKKKAKTTSGAAKGKGKKKVVK